MLKDLQLVFPDLMSGLKDHPIWIIPTFQKSHYDLVAVTPQTSWERNLCAQTFAGFCDRFRTQCLSEGLWADWTDPADGFPVHSARGNCIYPDVDGSVSLLKYGTVQVGCCRVLVHPNYGTRNYPATLFVKGPLETVKRILLSQGNVVVSP